MKTYDCPPTLTDSQVLDVCKQGYLVLEGVVPEEINRRTVEFVDNNPVIEPTEILDEDWFVEGVICQPEAAGAVRSLLGRNFVLPILMSNHRTHMPLEAQRWHRDGGSQYGPAQHYLQVFYYPETCTREMGPTELAARLAPHLLPVTPDGALREDQKLGLCGSAGRLDHHHGLLHLASALRLDGERHSQHAQVQLLAYRAAGARLDY